MSDLRITGFKVGVPTGRIILGVLGVFSEVGKLGEHRKSGTLCSVLCSAEVYGIRLATETWSRPKRDPERLAAHLRAFLDFKKHDELFSQGGCFHFAYCAWGRGIGTLHRMVSPLDPPKADQVFVVLPNGMVLDRLG